MHLGHLGVDGPRRHALFPIGVVAILDLQGDRPAEREDMAHPGRHPRAVLLDLHAPAAAVAELTARHVAVEVLGRKLDTGRQALDEASETGTVGLASGDETERHVRLVYLLASQTSLREDAAVALCAGGGRVVRCSHGTLQALQLCRANGTLRPGRAGGAAVLGDADDPDFIGHALAIGFDIFEYLIVTRFEVDRLTFRCAWQAGARTVQDRWNHKLEDRALASASYPFEDDPRILLGGQRLPQAQARIGRERRGVPRCARRGAEQHRDGVWIPRLCGRGRFGRDRRRRTVATAFAGAGGAARGRGAGGT